MFRTIFIIVVDMSYKILGLENIWIELSFKHKRVLSSLFYRFSNIVVTCDKVKSVHKALPIGKATGPDGIKNCILRELAHEPLSPLCSLFNQSLILGIVPGIRKKTHECPNQKGGDRTRFYIYITTVIILTLY